MPTNTCLLPPFTSTTFSSREAVNLTAFSTRYGSASRRRAASARTDGRSLRRRLHPPRSPSGTVSSKTVRARADASTSSTRIGAVPARTYSRRSRMSRSMRCAPVPTRPRSRRPSSASRPPCSCSRIAEKPSLVGAERAGHARATGRAPRARGSSPRARPSSPPRGSPARRSARGSLRPPCEGCLRRPALGHAPRHAQDVRLAVEVDGRAPTGSPRTRSRPSSGPGARGSSPRRARAAPRRPSGRPPGRPRGGGAPPSSREPPPGSSPSAPRSPR